MANFIAEYTQPEGKGEEEQRQWSIHTDGSSNQHAGGAGVVIKTPEWDKIECMIRLDFPTTNNEAEYEALVAGLDLAKVAGVENMIIHSILSPSEVCITTPAPLACWFDDPSMWMLHCPRPSAPLPSN